MDPITLMATITASYNGLKKAVAMGREVQDIVKQLGKWAEGADQMYSWIKNQEIKKPGLFQAIKFDKSVWTTDLTAKQYRIVKRYIEGDFFEYVLQGNFIWRNEQGGGNEWRDIETIEEHKSYDY